MLNREETESQDLSEKLPQICIEDRQKARLHANYTFKAHCYYYVMRRCGRGDRGRVMRFLLRMTFWLGVILVLLPSVGSQPTPKMQVGEAVTAARATVTDMRQFCERQPDACIIGSQTAVALGHRAQAGAKILYEFLNEKLGPTQTGTIGAANPSETGTATPLPPPRPAQHTLASEDLAPAWHGPQSRREPHSD
jgi:uncharacterized protein DUF5330